MDQSFEITVFELKKMLDKKQDFILLDCREPFEHNTAKIGNEKFIPLNEFKTRIKELDPNAQIILYCHHGDRSLYAAQYLRHSGFKAKSLNGGIDAWSKQIDKSVPLY